MTEHTPTPWKHSPNSFGTQFIYGDLEKPKQTPMGVSYFHLVAGGDHPSTLTETNAAFIIKAVNNHDALVNALIEAADRLEARGHKFGAREAWRILSDVGEARKP